MWHLCSMLSRLVVVMSTTCARGVNSVHWFRMCLWLWVESSYEVHIVLPLLFKLSGSQKTHWASTNIKFKPLVWVTFHEGNASLVSLVHVRSWMRQGFPRTTARMDSSLLIQNVLGTKSFYGLHGRDGAKASASCSGDCTSLEVEGIKATYFFFRHIVCFFYGLKNPYLARVWAFKFSLSDIIPTSWWWTYSPPIAWSTSS